MKASNLLQISVTPQNKKSKKISKNMGVLRNENNEKTDSLPLFSQLLLQGSLSNLSKGKRQKIAKVAPTPQSEKPSKLTKKTHKTLLTQQQLKLQKTHKTSNSQPISQLQNALSLHTHQVKPTDTHPIKLTESKTIRDIVHIANHHQLNLKKIHITQEKKAPLQPQERLRSPKIVEQESKITLKEKTPKGIEKAQTLAPNPQQQPTQTISTAPTILTTEQPLEVAPTLANLLNPKQEKEMLSDLVTEKKNESKEKTLDMPLSEIKKETQFKIAQSRETLTHFSNRLKEEIANYKPPFTKLSMELNPQELGKLEVMITKKGKELQIHINAHNPHALQTFIQNQNDFKNTLMNVGFNDIELNFSQGEGEKQKDQNPHQEQKGNKNRLADSIDLPLASAMEIKMVQYA